MQEYFEHLNKYYDKIYVLSVQAAETRRKLFSERFSGLDFAFYYGADKNNFTREELIEKNIYSEVLTKKHHRYNKPMMPGEIACAWSHRMIYEEMISKNYKRILIFEDDAVPDSKLMKQVSSILAEIPGNCEVLMWGWSKNGESDFKSLLKKTGYHIQHKFGLLKWNPKMIDNLFARPFSSKLRKAGFHDYTYAYAITRSGAEKLLAMQTPIQYIADNLLAHAITNNVVNGYIVYPAAVLHDSLSDGTVRDSYIR